jgi:ribonuclease HII
MTEKKIILGIDEAGRGPVIGPMVMAAVAIDEVQEKKLKWLGVKDSKLLSSEVREDLFERIKEIATDFRVEIIEPDAIDAAMLEEGYNINWLEADTAVRFISEVKADLVISDCPSINKVAYKEYLLNQLDKSIIESTEFIVEHKADENYIAVGAASILAKVVRDKAIDHIKNEIGKDFGSGYMSDEKTRKFLHAYYDKYPDIFRKYWKSYIKVKGDAEQSKLGDF